MANTVASSQRDVILDSINEGVFTVDLNWRITSFNRAAERITGISREEALGKPCWEVFRADICEDSCALRRTLETGKPLVDTRAHIEGEDGNPIPIHLSTAILKNRAGRIVGGVESFQDLGHLEQLKKELTRSYSFEDIVGRSAPMRKLFTLLPQIAESKSTVIIEGETGTGKELFARAIHDLSPRSGGPFVPISCGALPDTLLESELFGYKAGAFTDARQDKPGRFELASGGTIFLDEISEVSPAMQVRLLRVLQEGRIEPLGSVSSVPVDVRVIAATNCALEELVEQGRFREDLYYRIHVIHLKLPPLRERREDIPLLVDELVGRFNRIQGKSISGVSENVLARLMHHDYPGNVRELENIIEQAFVLCGDGPIRLEHLPPELRNAERGPESAELSLEDLERTAIERALARCGGHRRRAAAELGIDPSTLYRKMKRHGLTLPERDGRRNLQH
jgi:PAS domain S-box-containing protein